MKKICAVKKKQSRYQDQDGIDKTPSTRGRTCGEAGRCPKYITMMESQHIDDKMEDKNERKRKLKAMLDMTMNKGLEKKKVRGATEGG